MFDVTFPISISNFVEKKIKTFYEEERRKQKPKPQNLSLPLSFNLRKEKRKKKKKIVFGGFMFRGEEGNKMEGDGGEYLAGENKFVTRH